MGFRGAVGGGTGGQGGDATWKEWHFHPCPGSWGCQMASRGQISTGAGEAVGATALVGYPEGMEGSPPGLWYPDRCWGEGTCSNSSALTPRPRVFLANRYYGYYV